MVGVMPSGPPPNSILSQIKAKLVELVDKRKAMMETWEQRWEWLRLRECTGGAREECGSSGGSEVAGPGTERCPSLPQCWRCASSPAMPQWLSRGS